MGEKIRILMFTVNNVNKIFVYIMIFLWFTCDNKSLWSKSKFYDHTSATTVPLLLLCLLYFKMMFRTIIINIANYGWLEMKIKLLLLLHYDHSIYDSLVIVNVYDHITNFTITLLLLLYAYYSSFGFIQNHLFYQTFEVQI